MILTPIPPEHVGRIWPLVAEYLRAALARPGHDWTEPRVIEDCLTGHLQLWVVEDKGEAVSATTTRVLPDCVEVCHHGGSTDTWTACLPAIEEWAKKQGKDTIRVHGRPGWARVLPGYKLCYVALEKRIV